MKLFYGAYTLHGEKHAAIYDSSDVWKQEINNPDCSDIIVIPFVVHGKTYAARRESVRLTAVEWCNNVESWPLSWNELHMIADWFYRNGKRCGLLSELTENGLC